MCHQHQCDYMAIASLECTRLVKAGVCVALLCAELDSAGHAGWLLSRFSAGDQASG